MPTLPDQRPPVALREPIDVVAAVPYLLGHQPSDCVVVIALRGGRPNGGRPTRGGARTASQLGVVCRFDLPTVSRPAGARTLEADLDSAVLVVARRAVQALVADAAGAVMLVVYDQSDPPAPLGAAADEAIHALEQIVATAGIDVVDVLRVGPTRWRSLQCHADDCCPRDGVEVARASSRPVALGFIVAGRSPAADRGALEPPCTPAPAGARRVASMAATRWRRGRAEAGDLSARRRALHEWVSAVDTFHREGGLPTPTVSGRLGASWADDVHVRDACMVAVLPGSGLLPDTLLTGGAGDLAPLLGDPACAGLVVTVAPVLRSMAAHLRGDEQAAVLAVHAWLAWVSGAGAVAGDLAQRCLDVADQRLGRLVIGLLERAVPPDWAAPAADSSPEFESVLR